MPRNGSGAYSPPAGQPVVGGTVISSSVFNALVTDVGNEMTKSVRNDGRTPMTANLPMGGYKLTNVAVGSASTDGAQYGQIFDALALKVDTSALSSYLTTAAAATTYLAKSGGTMTGPLVLPVGSVGAPSITFAGDTDTGFYWVSAGVIGISINGAQVGTIKSTGIEAIKVTQTT